MKLQAYIGVLLITTLLACNNTSTNTTNAADSNTAKPSLELNTSENLITCWGIGEIDFEDNLVSIENKVGKSNISVDSLFLEGMFEQLLTTVRKGTDKEIVIYWEEKQPPFKTIKSLEINNSNSPYHFENGIKIGSTLNEMTVLNEQPINLYGFGWDYGGTFVDFNKGKLAGDMPCFGGVFQLKTTNTSNNIQQIMGDQKISSSHPAFKTHEAELKTIRISR